MLAAGRSNQAIARELVVTLDTVKSMWATSWASSARLTAPSPWPGPANLASSPDAPPVPPAGGGQRHQVPRGNRPTGAVRGPLPSCGSFAARPGHCIPTTARHKRRARLHLGARCPRKIPPGIPLSGDAWPAGFS